MRCSVVGGREVMAPAPELVVGAPPDALDQQPTLATAPVGDQPGPSGVLVAPVFVYEANVVTGEWFGNSVLLKVFIPAMIVAAKVKK
jgi:hypothetical protein